MSAAPYLGRRLFEFRIGDPRMLLALGLPAAILIGGGAAALAVEPRRTALAVLLFLLGAAAFVGATVWSGIRVLVHEFGVVEETRLFGSRQWHDHDFEHMDWRVTRKKAPMLRADLRTATGGFSFAVRLTGVGLQKSLDGLRDRIASDIAARAHEDLALGAVFPWGSDDGAQVRLQRDGIAFRMPKEILGYEEGHVPWTAPLETSFTEGVCVVQSNGARLFALATKEPDFYPGLRLFETLGREEPL
jgi:hypothetical protein